MSVWHENLVAYGRGYAMGRLLGRIDLNTSLSLAKQEEALALLRDLQQSKPSTSSLGMVKEFGSMFLKALVPYLTPYVGAAVMGIGALSVAAFKALTRGWPL